MLLPTMAMKSMVPNRNVHSTFCSTEISYGRTGGDFMHSRTQFLAANYKTKMNADYFVRKVKKTKTLKAFERKKERENTTLWWESVVENSVSGHYT